MPLASAVAPISGFSPVVMLRSIQMSTRVGQSGSLVMPSPGPGLWYRRYRLGGEYRAVIAPLIPDRPAVAVQQHRMKAHPVKSRDVLRLEALALLVGKVVAADVEIRCRTAANLTGSQVIEYAPVQLIQTHGHLTSKALIGLRRLASLPLSRAEHRSPSAQQERSQLSGNVSRVGHGCQEMGWKRETPMPVIQG